MSFAPNVSHLNTGRILLGVFLAVIGGAAVTIVATETMRDEPARAASAAAPEAAESGAVSAKDEEVAAAEQAPSVMPDPAAEDTALIANVEAAPAEDDPGFPAVARFDANPTASMPDVQGDAAAAPALREIEMAAAAPAEEDRTSSVSAAAAIENLVEPVAVAESEAEVAALEARLAESGSEFFAVPEDSLVTAYAPSGEGDVAEARVTAWVNMRAAPDQESEVLTVVPADERVAADANCEGWCAVSFNGREGYIYESYLSF